MPDSMSETRFSSETVGQIRSEQIYGDQYCCRHAIEHGSCAAAAAEIVSTAAAAVRHAVAASAAEGETVEASTAAAAVRTEGCAHRF